MIRLRGCRVCGVCIGKEGKVVVEDGGQDSLPLDLVFGLCLFGRDSQCVSLRHSFYWEVYLP
jgi:hypothetical protein